MRGLTIDRCEAMDRHETMDRGETIDRSEPMDRCERTDSRCSCVLLARAWQAVQVVLCKRDKLQDSIS